MSNDWVKKMFGLHDGGVYRDRPPKGPSKTEPFFLRPEEIPIVASGPTVTGRFSAKHPNIREQKPSKGTTVMIKSQQCGKTAEATARMVAADLSDVERRVMAQMATAFAVPEKVLRHDQRPPPDATADQWRKLFDIMIARAIDKELAYLLAYSGFDLVQCRIDEEGCGAIFAAAKEWPDDDG